MDEIGENGGRLYFRDQSGIGRAISYQSGNYRTIFSAVIFGALQGNQKENLMRRYIQYLLHGTGIEEERKTTLKITPNPVISSGKVLIQIPEGIERIRLFNLSGQLLKEWRLHLNNQKVISWDTKGFPAGTYLLSASGSFSITKSLILLP
ncbi:MAG: T9SS type A sorting domain-containing protein [candidate division WOR-3 bacterium]